MKIFLFCEYMNLLLFLKIPYIYECETAKLDVEIELRNYAVNNMNLVQKFFSAVFPVEYQVHHFIEMLHGDLTKLAFHKKKMVGFLYSHADFMEPHVFVISSIGCLPEYRRRGVASYLLRYALEYAERRKRFNITRLFVQTSNCVALKFYKKYGFQIIRTEYDYYINIVECDAYRMEKILHQKKVNGVEKNVSLNKNHSF